MEPHYTVTEGGIPRSIPLDGPAVFALPDGKALIQYSSPLIGQFHHIYPDQSFLEVVRLREQARAQ